MEPVAVDAMGGDRAPGEIVAGARRAADELGIPVVLVGRPEELGDTGGLGVIEASEVIPMDAEPGSSVRTMKDSSLVRAAEAVRDGRASAMVSAGNTGAAMGAALLRMGRIRGIARPAIATPIPTPGAAPTTMLDSGANAECRPEWLVQFARMGSVYARDRFGIERPRVGLLSIGEEAGKGNDFTKGVFELLSDGRWADDVAAEWIGNVEGRDIMTPEVDVVVTDGFTGNVTLKALEGALRGPVRPAAGGDRQRRHHPEGGGGARSRPRRDGTGTPPRRGGRRAAARGAGRVRDLARRQQLGRGDERGEGGPRDGVRRHGGPHRGYRPRLAPEAEAGR